MEDKIVTIVLNLRGKVQYRIPGHSEFQCAKLISLRSKGRSQRFFMVY
jgi:hypothetical protein